MNERMVVAVCMVVFVAGLLLLPMVSSGAQITHKQVELQGVVTDSFSTAGITIMSVRPVSPIPVVLAGHRKYSLGEWVSFNGTLREYDGRVEFFAD
jgi:hypothetical protein